MKRRDFVIATVATVVAVAVPGVYHSTQRKKRSGDPLMTPTTLEHFCSEEELRRIGTDYRSKNPSEDNEQKLTALLLSGNSSDNNKSLSKSGTTALLDKKIQQEFTAYKTIVVGGWVITETEARQCALFSLSHKN